MTKDMPGEGKFSEVREAEKNKLDTLARLADAARVSQIIQMIDDPSPQVRYQVLSTLVFDLNIKNERMRGLCLSMGERDPDEHVRHMAVSCLGSIDFSAERQDTFEWLENVLVREESMLVKTAAYEMMFLLMGQPPAKWPTLHRHPMLEKDEIDWTVIEEFRRHLSTEK